VKTHRVQEKKHKSQELSKGPEENKNLKNRKKKGAPEIRTVREGKKYEKVIYLGP